ncbi:MAG: hypothetical protein ACRD2R_06205 [Terriglobales bacterium]
MGKSERDPLFFPPGKQGAEPEEEEYSAQVDPQEQQKGLRMVLLFGLVLLAVLFRFCT